MWMGSKPIVTFNSYEMIQEAFVKQADLFSGRPKTREISKILRGGNYGIVMTGLRQSYECLKKE